MKKALLATTALMLSAGVAAADVKISGYGRTGVIYQESNDSGAQETQVISRLRMNLDASTETDAGVEFGGRFRLQWDQNNSTRGRDASTNAGKLWIRAQGLTVEIGNIDTAFDNAGLKSATELGAYDRSVGVVDTMGNFFAYDSTGATFSGDPLTQGGYNPGRVGVAAIYSFGDVTVRGSYVDPDQRIDGDFENEISLAVDYTWNDRLELSGAFAMNGAGIEDNDVYFLGARYAVMDNARVGIHFSDADGVDGQGSAEFAGQTIALYGDYTLADGLTNIEAYVANNDNDDNETDTAYGIGVNYDLGGARLGASIQRDYDELVTADMGVRFNF